MKKRRKGHYLTEGTMNKYVFSFSFIFQLMFLFSSMGVARSCTVVWDDGLAFIDSKLAYVDPEKMTYTSLLKSLDTLSKDEKIVKNMELSFSVEKKLLTVYDSEIKRPYLTLPETKRVFKYKIKKNVLFIKSDKSNWCPVKFKFIRHLKSGKETVDEAQACMLISVSTKWFQGNYEVLCGWK
jgi:hypothetical protein